jgi:hypothetical protein
MRRDQVVAAAISRAYEGAGRAAEARGNRKEWASDLGQAPGYADRLGERLHRTGGRHLQLEHVVALLKDPKSEPIMSAALMAIAGRELGALLEPELLEEQHARLQRRVRERFGEAGAELLAELARDLL